MKKLIASSSSLNGIKDKLELIIAMGGVEALTEEEKEQAKELFI